MILGQPREEPAQTGINDTGKCLHQPGFFRQAHDAAPDGQKGGQANGHFNRIGGAVYKGGKDLIDRAAASRYDHAAAQ